MNETDLIVHAGKAAPIAKQGPAAGKLLGGEDLAGIFGLDMAQSTGAEAGLAKSKPAKTKRARTKKAAAPVAKRKPRKPASSKRRRKKPAEE